MATEPKQRMRITLIKEAIARLVSADYNLRFHFTRYFEEAGCSCSPLRRELETLHRLCAQLEDQMREHLRQTDPFKRREAIAQHIKDIDNREHASLDSRANLAFPFFRVWLFERLSDPEGSLNLTTPDAAAQSYAEAWLRGWRPNQTIDKDADTK